MSFYYILKPPEAHRTNGFSLILIAGGLAIPIPMQKSFFPMGAQYSVIIRNFPVINKLEWNH
jgi:hypothetical protein